MVGAQVLLERREHIDAIPRGQADVQDHPFGPVAGDQLEPRLAAGGRDALEAVFMALGNADRAEARVVLNNKDSPVGLGEPVAVVGNEGP